jgi:peptidoglycan/xylan/chitin deacetylase (PgdA/CDA1 family)
MKRKPILRYALICTVLLLLCATGYMLYGTSTIQSEVDNLFLLIPDGVDQSDPIVREWIDAAGEEGLHLKVLHDSEFLSPIQRARAIPGLIVPDLIHRSANGTLIGALHEFVHHGGNLMVVYDACTWDLDKNFSKLQSRLSDLVGVSYALYDRYQTDSIRWSSVWGDANAMRELEIPPGKFVPAGSVVRSAKLQAASLKKDGDEFSPAADQLLLTRYEYEYLHYPTFRTLTDFDGKVLLYSTGGVAAGVRNDNKGRVLFVNVPLGYLEARTDGMLMHSFLRYFAVKMLGLPVLAAVPDGIGGLIFNWHIDAKSMVGPLEQLVAAGVFDRGPYSIDFTAGPDVDQEGDGKGLNVGRDPVTDHLIQQLQRRGHMIGSHGGWIHNYFGEHVTEKNGDEFASYIDRNIKAIEKVTGKPVTEYSAPLGNHPKWASEWLEARNIKAYYFAGDTGMGPTQVYREGSRDGDSTWAFPIVHLGRYASLEEMGFANVNGDIIKNWLNGVAVFTSDNRTARLVYTHPLGATKYISAIRDFLHYTDQLSQEHRFRWYTMSQLADFLNARKETRWSVLQKDNGKVVLRASHPQTLNHYTWVFPGQHFEEPKVRSGEAQVKFESNEWTITAGDCRSLSVDLARK